MSDPTPSTDTRHEPAQPLRRYLAAVVVRGIVRGLRALRSIPVVRGCLAWGGARIAASPRAAYAVILTSGFLLTGWHLGTAVHLFAPAERVNPPAMIASATAAPGATSDTQARVLAVIQDYNAAAIADGAAATTTAMACCVDPTSPAWRDIQAGAADAQARGITRTSTLVRWSLVHAQLTDDTATIALQEQWDSIAWMHGATIIGSTRGALSRVTYTLARHDAQWQIVAIASTTIVE